MTPGPGGAVRPPRLAQWLAGWGARGVRRETLLGDLEEGFHRRLRRGVEVRAARRWYWGQVVRGFRWGLPAGQADRHRRLRGDPSAAFRQHETRSDLVTYAILRDVRVALRALRRRPAFTVVVVVTLGLGLGSITAILSVANGVLLRPLLYPAADRIVSIADLIEGTQQTPVATSYRNVTDWREETGAFEAMGVTLTRTMVLTDADRAIRLFTNFASPGYFDVLGVTPHLGRVFTSEEDRIPSGHRVAILSHGLWQRHFGGAPSVLDRVIVLNDVPYTVIGVLPNGFRDPFETATNPVELWVPAMQLGLTDAQGDAVMTGRRFRRFGTLARFHDGTDFEAARTELSNVVANLAREYPDANGGIGVQVLPLGEAITLTTAGPVTILMVGAGFLLLVACLNVTMLLLVRGYGRQREMAVRLALGAGRRAVVRAFGVEATVLALAGGVLGVWLAGMALGPLLRMSPAQLPTVIEIGLDSVAIGATLGTALLVGVLIAVVPAWRASRSTMPARLGQGARGSETRGSRRLANGLVIFEIASAMILLVGSGLLVRSFQTLRATGAGYDPEGVLTVRLDLPATRYGNNEAVRLLYHRLQDELGALPGVEWAQIWAPGRPGFNPRLRTNVPEGMIIERASDSYVARLHAIEPGLLTRLGMRIIRGREFMEEDDARSRPVALVSSSLAARMWPGEDAIGKRLHQFIPPSADPSLYPRYEVVGVVADAKLSGRLQIPGLLSGDLDVYHPLAQLPQPSITVLIKGDRNPTLLTAAVRETIAAIDSDLPMFGEITLEESLAQEEATARFTAVLMALFGGLALFLAALGVYGLLSYAVRQRTRELGIRAAVGATTRENLRLVLRSGARLAVTGVGAGLVLALVAGRFMESLLFEVTPADPVALGGSGVLLIAVSLLACYVPGQRAARIDPVLALRED